MVEQERQPRAATPSWNQERGPLIGWELLIPLGVSAVWLVVTVWYPWWEDLEFGRWTGALIIAYGWVGGGGLFVSFFAIEFGRWLFSKGVFHLEDEGHRRYLRAAPRLRPIVEGILERLLFTTAAISVLYLPESKFILLGVLLGAYLVLRGIPMVSGVSGEDTPAYSVYGLWGLAISMSFAAYGGVVYHQIVGTL